MFWKHFLTLEYYQMCDWILKGSMCCVVLFSVLLILFRKKRNKALIYGLIVSLAGYATGYFLCLSSVLTSIFGLLLKSIIVKTLVLYFASLLKFMLMCILLVKCCKELLKWYERKQSFRKVLLYLLLPLILLAVCEMVMIPVQMEIALEVPGTVLSRENVGAFVRQSIYRPYTSWGYECIYLVVNACSIVSAMWFLKKESAKSLQDYDAERKEVPIRNALVCAGIFLCGYVVCLFFKVDMLFPLWTLLSVVLILLVIFRKESSTFLLLISIMITLTGCLLHYVFLFNDKSVLHDSYYGVKYTVDTPRYSSLRINVDTIGNEIITSLSIINYGDTSENEDAEKLYECFPEELRGVTQGVSYQTNKNEVPAHYLYQTQRNQPYFEIIVLNLYHEDYLNYDFSEMYEYLGIADEMKNGKITYQELKNCETFRFKWLFEKGEYDNNISFLGEEKYTFIEND